jgi:hypothetical protein
LKIYTGVISILVESALPFSILGIVYGVYVGIGKAPQVALGIIWSAFFVSRVAVTVQLSRIEVLLMLICRFSGAISSAHYFEGGDGPCLVRKNKFHTHYVNCIYSEYREEHPGGNNCRLRVKWGEIEDTGSQCSAWEIEGHLCDFGEIIH